MGLRYRYTTIVLKEVPQFKEYYPELYQLALGNLVEHFYRYNGGFPSVTEGGLDILATAWFLAILDSYYESYRSMIESGFDNLITSVKKPEDFLPAYSPDWAAALELCATSFAPVQLDQSRRAYLDEVVENLERSEEQIGLDNIRVRDFLPSELHWLEDAVLVHVFLPEHDRDGRILRGRTLSQRFEERRRELLRVIERRYSDERKIMAEKQDDLDKFIAKVRREKGERAARDLEDVYKQQAQLNVQTIQKRYGLLKDRTLRATSVRGLEQLESEVYAEWTS